MTKDEKYTEMIVLLIKSFLDFASRIISVSNIGKIHRFTGDGLIASFGEDLDLDFHEKARVACALSLLCALLLKRGFEKLWLVAQKHPMNIEFLGQY